MIEYLLKNAEFSKIFKFISPNFLRVASPAVLFGVAQRLQKSRKETAAGSSLVQTYSKLTSAAPLGVQIDSQMSSETVGSEKGSETQAHAIPVDSFQQGTQILTLFFHQILSQDTWILDFRSEAFKIDEAGKLRWRPQLYFYEMPQEFLVGIRSLYRGFYHSDDVLFDRSLARLGLSSSKEALRSHFGVGDQTHVNFQLKTFQNTFTEVFEACAREGVKLPPEFFVLGLSLLGLYENLETLGAALDVRSCFERASTMCGAEP